MKVILTIAAILAATTSAQFVAGTDGNDGSPSLLCNQSFADANATGIFSFNPGVVQGDQEDQPDNDSNHALDAQWGITVYNNIGQSNSTLEIAGWYNTNGANYSDNAGLWYDVCLVTLNGFSFNTMYRAAADEGRCLQTFDDVCAGKLETQAADYANGLVSNPTPNPGSNLTQGSLSHVCYDIGNLVQDNFPKECEKYLNSTDSASLYGTAMTSHNESFIYSGCTLHNDENNGTFHYATQATQFTSQYDEDTQKILYSNFTQVVIPVMTIFLPIADVEATTSISGSNAILSCPHPNHINPGSLEPYPPPTPTPVGSGGDLSGGAIAGIVIGVLAALGMLGSALWFFWFRKRRASRKGLKSEDGPPPAYPADAKVAEAPYTNEQMPLTELSGYDSQVRPELATQRSGPRVELAGDTGYGKVDGPPAELPGAIK